MGANRHNIAALADRLTNLADAYKADVDVIIEEAKQADLDIPALRRYVSWSRKDAVKRAEQEAIDEQYRFLAGERETPAALPDEGELAQAVRFYADGMSVRQVADVLKVSVGKAQKLRTIARVFTVHREMNVNRDSRVVEDDDGCVRSGEGTVVAPVDPPSALPEPEASLAGEADAPAPVREMVADDLGDPLLILNPFRAKLRAIKPKANPALELVRQASASVVDIDLTPPAFLVRRRA